MTDIKHLDVIEWPNGEGCTPCSIQYRNKRDEAKVIMTKYASEAEMTPEDYQRYNELCDNLLTLAAEGHVGKSVRY